MRKNHLSGIADKNRNPLREYYSNLPMAPGFILIAKGDVNKYALLPRFAGEIAEKQWNKKLLRF